ncbi:NAD(P)H:quinone oxidoreductase [Brevundimonas sp.]|jgi:NAD(P)H dehydrogenase (quinone)|uniref:NAD(P)H:quinone oxidoreductase n=1 Tax=Brevundimonas sp. TaxID=1871086 RepID=UPI00180D911C|nr:NAD(P)H:quinone oxidoreductase [Brevundimonas sp.]MBA4806002.1 NAD(P)H:quinone oxidoreductase [Brevundimonas sp.]
MPKILVLYHSTYGHIEAMAEAIAEGAREVEGAVVDIKRVPETVPEELAKSSGYKLDQKAPIAVIDDLKDYDAIILGAGTRFGSAASQMRAFLDQAGGLWFTGALLGKVGGAFTASATQHGGQETTFQGLHNFFMHHGMPVVGLPYAYQAMMTLDTVEGGSPYGATTITGGDGSRMPSEIELGGAKFQGRHIAQIAKKLHG